MMKPFSIILGWVVVLGLVALFCFTCAQSQTIIRNGQIVAGTGYPITIHGASGHDSVYIPGEIVSGSILYDSTQITNAVISQSLAIEGNKLTYYSNIGVVSTDSNGRVTKAYIYPPQGSNRVHDRVAAALALHRLDSSFTIQFAPGDTLDITNHSDLTADGIYLNVAGDTNISAINAYDIFGAGRRRGAQFTNGTEGFRGNGGTVLVYYGTGNAIHIKCDSAHSQEADHIKLHDFSIYMTDTTTAVGIYFDYSTRWSRVSDISVLGGYVGIKAYKSDFNTYEHINMRGVRGWGIMFKDAFVGNLVSDCEIDGQNATVNTLPDSGYRNVGTGGSGIWFTGDSSAASNTVTSAIRNCRFHILGNYLTQNAIKISKAFNIEISLCHFENDTYPIWIQGMQEHPNQSSSWRPYSTATPTRIFDNTFTGFRTAITVTGSANDSVIAIENNRFFKQPVSIIDTAIAVYGANVNAVQMERNVFYDNYTTSHTAEVQFYTSNTNLKLTRVQATKAHFPALDSSFFTGPTIVRDTAYVSGFYAGVGSQLVTNGTFETGNFNGWKDVVSGARIVTGSGHGGSYFAKAKYNNGNGAFRETLTVSPSRQYIYSAWARSTPPVLSGSTDKGHPRLIATGDGSYPTTDANFPNVDTTNWTYISTVVTTTPTQTYLIIRPDVDPESPSGTDSCFYDDISLQQIGGALNIVGATTTIGGQLNVTPNAHVGSLTVDSTSTLTGNVTMSGDLIGSSTMVGSDAFTTTATADTVTISGAGSSDYYMVTLTGSAAPSANDAFRVQATSTGFIIRRSSSGTSGLTYNWVRFKHP